MSYGPTTTTDEVLAGHDLHGRRVVVTGASSGLGEESSRALAAAGATVAMLARDEAKLDAAAARIRDRVPDARLEVGRVDLADLASVRAAGGRLVAGDDPIDVLINNAGVMACPQGRTADGFEVQLGTNHLGHFLLTALAMPALLAAEAPRVVTLSSAGHSIADVDVDDLGFEQGSYDPWIAYGRSKSANARFARGLAARFGDRGLQSYSVHPGAILTDLGRHLDEELLAQMMERSRARGATHGEDAPFAFKPVEAGAATQVWASVADLAGSNGAYLADCGLGEAGGNPNHAGFETFLLDDDVTDRLWSASEELVAQALGA
ncbi:MAG: SDR family NAD(P)-dependent oxidoreductase [Acidimicrobiales bacterium]|nr:SDR family NAD(P)-dependent oxidoreductase [Acidimicrobiales bacterium]